MSHVSQSVCYLYNQWPYNNEIVIERQGSMQGTPRTKVLISNCGEITAPPKQEWETYMCYLSEFVSWNVLLTIRFYDFIYIKKNPRNNKYSSAKIPQVSKHCFILPKGS